MRAGPASIAKDATILDWATDANGKFVVLRQGSNGWFCFPDTPGTPTDDPMCADQTWLDWSYAYLAGEAPTVTVPGIAYMLQGDSGASNTDPFATEPAPGQDWVVDGPHLMILMPGDLDQGVLLDRSPLRSSRMATSEASDPLGSRWIAGWWPDRATSSLQSVLRVERRCLDHPPVTRNRGIDRW